MSDSSKDFIDLNPYFKLISIGFSKMTNAIKKNLWLIILLTVLIMVGKMALDIRKPDYYKSAVTLKSDQLSFDVLRNSLNAFKSNLKGSNQPIEIVYRDDSIRIYDVQSKVNVSYRDSLMLSMNSKEDFNINDLEFDYSFNVEIVSTNDSSSPVDGFVQFLNTQRYITHERSKLINAKKDRLAELKNQIAMIDSTVLNLSESKSDAHLKQNGSSLFLGDDREISELIIFKNELIDQKLNVENDLESLREQEIFKVSSSNEPLKIKKNEMFSISSWMLSAILSLFIILAVRFFRSL